MLVFRFPILRCFVIAFIQLYIYVPPNMSLQREMGILWGVASKFLDGEVTPILSIYINGKVWDQKFWKNLVYLSLKGLLLICDYIFIRLFYQQDTWKCSGYV